MRGTDDEFDLLVVGAGINGAGVARDAAGRGLRVLICDQGDIAGATSSASTKLIHGGLRYLEHRAFGLVREALAEREVMLKIAGHLVREQRFVIPAGAGGRPAWLIGLGLLLYDHLGGKSSLQRSKSVTLDERDSYGAPIAVPSRRGFVYSDLSVDDARLTLLNVLSAAELGSTVLTRTRLEGARRDRIRWQARLVDAQGKSLLVSTRVIVNAAGPWVQRVRQSIAGTTAMGSLRLVKGSHIVLPRLYEGDHAYLLQNEDGRIVFVIPFEGDFTLAGTTEVAVPDPDSPVCASEVEVDYLCRALGRFLRTSPTPADTVWRYAGVRALYDDGKASASAITREYRFGLDGRPGEAAVLSIYGGKLTTYRRLAERVLARLAPWFPKLGPAWTAEAPLPGANLGEQGLDGIVTHLVCDRPQLDPTWLPSLARRHGTRASTVLSGVFSDEDRGEHFGAGFYACEVRYMLQQEWAGDLDDLLWRRTKLGLHLNAAQRMRLSGFLESVEVPAQSIANLSGFSCRS